MKQSSAYYFYHNDHLGTPQQMTDINGAVVWSARYDSFGKAEVDQASTITNNLRFPGQYYDDETNLYYNWNRYYEPATAMYLRVDPLRSNVIGLNSYRYALNNPTNMIDPVGLITFYFGVEASAYYYDEGSLTAGAGGIMYSDQTGWFLGNYGSFGYEDAFSGDIHTTAGGGVGAGYTVGFMTGSLYDFEGKTTNLAINVYFFGITYSQNDASWGVSISYGGKGFGLGYYMYESNTFIVHEFNKTELEEVIDYCKKIGQ